MKKVLFFMTIMVLLTAVLAPCVFADYGVQLPAVTDGWENGWYATKTYVDSELYCTRAYEFNERGDVVYIKSEYESDNIEAGDYLEHGDEVEYGYDADGRLITEVWTSRIDTESYQTKFTYVYGESGKLNAKETQHGFLCDEYDDNGNYIGEYFDLDGKENVTYTYDGSGKLVSVEGKSFYFRDEYDEDGNYIGEYVETNEVYSETFTYDGNGVLTEMNGDYSQDGYAAHRQGIYEDGLLVKYIETPVNLDEWLPVVTTYTYEHDANGRIVSYTRDTLDGYDVCTYTYEYDANGNLCKETIHQQMSEQEPYEAVYTYEYERLGSGATCGNGHSYDDGVVTVEPTTVTPGEKTYTCAVCGHSYTEEIPMLDPTNPFTDVEEGRFFYDSVMWAVDQGITSGVSATKFDPDADCTRAQVVTFLWRAAGEPEPTTTTHPFTDVSSKAFYYKAMLWAVEEGITAGTSATKFSPNDECTRGQVVTFLWRAAEKPAPQNTAHPFTDVSSSAFYYKGMLWAVENGVTAGYSKTTFNPGGYCTRGQVVTFLYRWFA